MKHHPETLSPDPHAEYTRRLGARRAVVDRYERLRLGLGNARLASAGAAVVLGWLVFAHGLIAAGWLAAPVVVFVALLVIHDRVLRALRRARRAADFYERGLARLEDRWAGKGEQGARFQDDKHPYARDLDLFGAGGLFELLCTARTVSGEETLARWLMAPASPEQVRARQEAVEELRPRLDLREDLAVLGEEVRTGIDAEALPKWGEEPPLLDSRLARVVAAALACVTAPLAAWLAVAFFSWMGAAQPSPPDFGFYPELLLILATVEAGFALAFRRRVQRVILGVEHHASELALLSEILVRLEREQFSSGRLAELRRALDTEGRPASRRIARLNRLIELVDSRHHVVVRIIGPLLLWTTQLAFAIEAWRRTTGPSVRHWLAAVGEFEALSALAGYACEHPDDPFPELAEGPARFDAVALGHPLIPASRCVRNDVRLDTGLQVLVISGSNMSGKTTLLRTIGTNAVLAMAGAPVRAGSLKLAPLAVGASIRMTDSLQEGTSRFYAEITRIRELVDIARGSRTLLFLLDELLHGTNSHDRRIGAEAVVRGLAEQGALGLITTHDLALAHIAEALAPCGVNVHFTDHLEDGRMTFDYKLHPGVVRKSNALELMRSVGLDV